MTWMPERELSEGKDIVRTLRQSRRIRPVRSNRVKVLSGVGALFVLSGALLFALHGVFPPMAPQVANVPGATSVPTQPAGPPITAARNGTLGKDSQSLLDKDRAPAPSTTEPVRPPESTHTASQPVARAGLEKAPVMGPKDQTSAAGQAAPPSITGTLLREIDPLLARAEQLLAAGDLAGARLLFERAVTAGDLRGADGLARSYDPKTLRQLPVYGLTGDPAAATRWRETAQGQQRR